MVDKNKILVAGVSKVFICYSTLSLYADISEFCGGILETREEKWRMQVYLSTQVALLGD
jgi:hypothetical protein